MTPPSAEESFDNSNLADLLIPSNGQASHFHEENDDAHSGILPKPKRSCRRIDLLCCFAMIVSLISALWFTAHMWRAAESSSSKSSSRSSNDANVPSLFIVETIPLLNDSLTLIPGALHTHDVLVNLVRAAQETLDISVMYWNLLASDDDDYDDVIANDCTAYGCARGAALYNAMIDAVCTRSVRLRILQDNSTSSLGSQDELWSLMRAVEACGAGSMITRAWDAKAWYGGGIMHMKLWVVDGRHVYVGSANMDWLSLAQVKEMGIVAYNCSSTIATVAQDYFDSYFSFADRPRHSGISDDDKGAADWLDPSTMTVSSFNPSFGAMQKVPCWEAALTRGSKCPDPLRPLPSASSVPRWQDPGRIRVDGLDDDGSSDSDFSITNGNIADGSTYFLSASPVALLGDCSNSAPPDMNTASSPQLVYGDRLVDCARTWDEDALVQTILDAKHSVSLSVMDFLPTNAFAMNTSCSNFGGGGKVGYGPGAVTWNRLLNAVATAVYSNGVQARLLISHWAHSDPDTYAYLSAFEAMGAITAQRIINTNEEDANIVPGSPHSWNGSLEIGVFQVPGWENTEGVNASGYDPSLPPFAPYSRVNHAKYIVTDRRFNVGTSNYQPSYFYQTAGTSFNSDEPSLITILQAAFDRDWRSGYTIPLTKFLESRKR